MTTAIMETMVTLIDIFSIMVAISVEDVTVSTKRGIRYEIIKATRLTKRGIIAPYS